MFRYLEDDNVGKYFKNDSFSGNENATPIPAGLSPTGFPYFTPPVWVLLLTFF